MVRGRFFGGKMMRKEAGSLGFTVIGFCLMVGAMPVAAMLALELVLVPPKPEVAVLHFGALSSAVIVMVVARILLTFGDRGRRGRGFMSLVPGEDSPIGQMGVLASGFAFLGLFASGVRLLIAFGFDAGMLIVVTLACLGLTAEFMSFMWSFLEEDDYMPRMSRNTGSWLAGLTSTMVCFLLVVAACSGVWQVTKDEVGLYYGKVRGWLGIGEAEVILREVDVKAGPKYCNIIRPHNKHLFPECP